MFIAKFIQTGTGPRISVTILKKKHEVGEIAASEFKAPGATVIEGQTDTEVGGRE